MPERKKVLAICGSIRSNSTNLSLIEAIINLSVNTLQIELYKKLNLLPHFNPDVDTVDPPAAVVEFRKLLSAADGVLICTPEYAMGVPGTLKNALDWIVSSSGFLHTPVALITASTSGIKAHQSLLDTLKVLEAEIGEKCQLLISFAKTKVATNATITDAATKLAIEQLITEFTVAINNRLLVKNHFSDSID